MGNYTYVDYHDLEVIDLAGLKDFLQKIKDRKYKEYEGQEYLAESIQINDDGTIDVIWEDWKIIGYWYEHFVLFLRDLAVFIDGHIELRYENQDLGGSIDFEDGECTINQGEMDWHETTPEEEFAEKHPLREEIKASLLLRKL